MKRIFIVGVAAVVVIVAGALIWLNFLRSEGPEEFGLTENATDGTSTANADDVFLDSLDGAWTVAPGSEAGYRVVEDLRNVQDFEAVGRSEQVTGSVLIDGTVVTEASFEIDVASITSDSARRDSAFTGADIMNTAEFPTAILVLTEATDFGAVPATGELVTTTVAGELTLRDVTQPVEFDIDAQIINGQIELVGSIGVIFSDFGIENPSNSFVTVRDEGTVEVKLLLEQ